MRGHVLRALGYRRAAARQRAKEAEVRHQLRLQARLGMHHSHVAALCPNFCPNLLCL